jgi:hypothetical protein
MKNQIRLQNKKVNYLVKKSDRAKRLRLAIYCDGSFVVTVPSNFELNNVEGYILQKAQWILEKLQIMKKRGNSKIFTKRSEREYQKLKSEALIFAQKKVEKFNKVYGFKFNEITIKNQKTRWGSCSRKGNLNYNYKIALLPERLADYIIVHELCHLKEFNHGKKFWNQVEKALPDYKERIEEIKKL